MASGGLVLKAKQRISDVDWRPPEHFCEEYERYQEGGYCPIITYQELKGNRYKVVYKLGHGCSATVWLARDTHAPDGCHVALKVLCADQSAATREIDLLRMVTNHDTVGPSGPTYVINVLDEFEIVSGNGLHRVMAMPVTRPIMSLANSKVPIRSVIKSLIKGLENIHSAGIVHGGKNR